ncbi:MAG: hypothetical protein ACR2O6_06915 [Ilumatobacteraceae bacterium]
MIDKLARIGRPGRRAVALVAVAGLVVAVDASTGSAENDSVDGREPDAIPGDAVSSSPAPAASDDGRSGQIVLTAPTTRSAAVVVIDNGRGGEDPAQGPNAVTRSAPFESTDSGEFDTDSGEASVANAAGAPTGRSLPVDEDVPGMSQRVRPPTAVVDEAPADQDG